MTSSGLPPSDLEGLRIAYRVAELLLPREVTWQLIGQPLYSSIVDRRLVWRVSVRHGDQTILEAGPFETPSGAMQELISRFPVEPGEVRLERSELTYRYHVDEPGGRESVRETVRLILRDDPSAAALFPTFVRHQLTVREMWPTDYPSPPGLFRVPRWDEE